MRNSLIRSLALIGLALGAMAVLPQNAEARWFNRGGVVSSYYYTPAYGYSYGTSYSPLYGYSYGNSYYTPLSRGYSYGSYSVPGIYRGYSAGYRYPGISYGYRNYYAPAYRYSPGIWIR